MEVIEMSDIQTMQEGTSSQTETPPEETMNVEERQAILDSTSTPADSEKEFLESHGIQSNEEIAEFVLAQTDPERILELIGSATQELQTLNDQAQGMHFELDFSNGDVFSYVKEWFETKYTWNSTNEAYQLLTLYNVFTGGLGKLASGGKHIQINGALLQEFLKRFHETQGVGFKQAEKHLKVNEVLFESSATLYAMFKKMQSVNFLATQLQNRLEGLNSESNPESESETAAA
jgi:hypothetical protein